MTDQSKPTLRDRVYWEVRCTRGLYSDQASDLTDRIMAVIGPAFGSTQQDVADIMTAVEYVEMGGEMEPPPADCTRRLRSFADRIAALLPQEPK